MAGFEVIEKLGVTFKENGYPKRCRFCNEIIKDGEKVVLTRARITPKYKRPFIKVEFDHRNCPDPPDKGTCFRGEKKKRTHFAMGGLWNR